MLRSLIPAEDGPDAFYGRVLLAPSAIAEVASSPATLEAVLQLLARLEPDSYTRYLETFLREGIQRYGAAWKPLDIMNVLHAAATLIQPRRYLEIGVRRGRSISMVLGAAPAAQVVGVDLWTTNYAGMANPGPRFVLDELAKVAPAAKVDLLSGDSHALVPRYLREHPGETFDLITVDGDHSRRGARSDLETVLPALSLGGALVFDDVAHPAHPYLLEVWRKAVARDGGLSAFEFTELGYGVAFAVRHRERRR